MSEILFSALVVTYNEARHLRACLESLSFCDEIVVVDLGSEDESIKIAQMCGANVIEHKRLPLVEQVIATFVADLKNQWVITIDPDEVLPPGTDFELREAIREHPSAGLIHMPIQYYFLGKQLHCTLWGQRDMVRPIASHVDRVHFFGDVHRGRTVLKDYKPLLISIAPIQHYWIDSYGQLFEKHLRYIQHEGESRYRHGMRFSWGAAFLSILKALKNNILDYDGWCCGWTGIFLSLFYTWYIGMSWLSLRQYQIQMQKKDE